MNEHPKQTEADWEDANRLSSNVMVGNKVRSTTFGEGIVIPMLGSHRWFVCVDFGALGKIEVSADQLFRL